MQDNGDHSVHAMTQCGSQYNPLKRPQQHAVSQVFAKKIASSAPRDTINNDLLSAGNATVGYSDRQSQALTHSARSTDTPLDDKEEFTDEKQDSAKATDIDSFEETMTATEGDDDHTAPNGISFASDANQSSTSLTSPSSSASATPSTATTAANTTVVAGVEKSVFDPSAVETILLTIGGVEVGTGFRELQREAALVVNDRNKKLTFERLPMFMSCNYILNLDSELPGVDEVDMNKDTHAHSSLDALMALVFPTRFRSIELS
ncbi:hypothetical protein BGX24_003147 [Mortierella sp. AD032]|nr:hypothetical protein BGX24_003147 [Mortierella sp. AD032]